MTIHHDPIITMGHSTSTSHDSHDSHDLLGCLVEIFQVLLDVRVEFGDIVLDHVFPTLEKTSNKKKRKNLAP